MSAELRRSASGQPPVVVQVWGPGALFTRPEFRVERLTYPVMTPTAAIGVLESIFWKPEFSWDPVAIEVLRDIRQFTLRRNETSDLPSLTDAVRHGRRIDTVRHRDQRNAVCLREVAYRIHAHVEVSAGGDEERGRLPGPVPPPGEPGPVLPAAISGRAGVPRLLQRPGRHPGPAAG